MASQSAIKIEARLFAIEYFLAEAFRMIYGVLGVSVDQVEASHERLRQHLQTLSEPSDDAAVGDLVAAEIEEAHTRILKMIADALRDQRTAKE